MRLFYKSYEVYFLSEMSITVGEYVIYLFYKDYLYNLERVFIL